MVLDTRINQYTTRDDIFIDSHRDGGAGKLFVLDGTDIKLIEGSNDDKIMDYKTGEIVLSDPDRKRFRETQFFAKLDGPFNASFFIDGIEVLDDIPINNTSQQRSRRVRLPSNKRGRSLNIQMVGQTEITEIKIDVLKRSK